MDASDINFKMHDLTNLGDQYCARLLQAKAGLPKTFDGLGIQEAFLHDNPELDKVKAMHMFGRRSIPFDYLIRFENWAEKKKKQLQTNAA